MPSEKDSASRVSMLDLLRFVTAPERFAGDPSPARPGSERRKHPRIKVKCGVRLRRLGVPGVFDAVVEDISNEGFFCISDEPFAPFEKLDCEVEVEDFPVLYCRAEVVHVEADGLAVGYGIGCRLIG